MSTRERHRRHRHKEPATLNWEMGIFYRDLEPAAAAEISGLLTPLVRVIREHDYYPDQPPFLSGANPETKYRFYARRERPIELYVDEDGSAPRRVVWLFEFGQTNVHVRGHATNLKDNDAIVEFLVQANFYDVVNELLLPKLREAFVMLMPAHPDS